MEEIEGGVRSLQRFLLLFRPLARAKPNHQLAGLGGSQKIGHVVRIPLAKHAGAPNHNRAERGAVCRQNFFFGLFGGGERGESVGDKQIPLRFSPQPWWWRSRRREIARA